MHIPHHLMLPQDKVDVLDKETGAVARWHAVDFKHAATVEPERYVLAGLKQEKAAEPIPEVEEVEVTGAQGLAWYPPPEEETR